MTAENDQTVLLSQCPAAVFRASTMTLTAVPCPDRACGTTVAVVGAALAPHHDRAGECSHCGAWLVDDRVATMLSANVSHAEAGAGSCKGMVTLVDSWWRQG